MVLAIAALVGYLGTRISADRDLIETIGTWISVVVLVAIAGMNLRQLAAGRTTRRRREDAVASEGAARGSSPLLAIPVGLLFGFGFETSSQVATYALAFGVQSGVTGALIVGGMFCLGMIVTDTLDSVLVHRLVSDRSSRLPQTMRVWIWSVTMMALAVAAYELAQLLGWRPPFDDAGSAAHWSASLIAVFGYVFLRTRRTRTTASPPIEGGRLAWPGRACSSRSWSRQRRRSRRGRTLSPTRPRAPSRPAADGGSGQSRRPDARRAGRVLGTCRRPATCRTTSLSPRNLSEQYLQRYRERGDIGDVDPRARDGPARGARRAALARIADGAMAAALLALHRFAEARAYVRDAEQGSAPDAAESSHARPDSTWNSASTHDVAHAARPHQAGRPRHLDRDRRSALRRTDRAPRRGGQLAATRDGRLRRSLPRSIRPGARLVPLPGGRIRIRGRPHG